RHRGVEGRSRPSPESRPGGRQAGGRGGGREAAPRPANRRQKARGRGLRGLPRADRGSPVGGAPMKRVAVLLALSLTACATPRERIVYRDVPTPIPVPCAVEAPPEQKYAADKVDLDADLFELVKALLVDR